MNNIPAGSLWPQEYIDAGLDPRHCDDVLAGCYDVPFKPEKPPVILDIGANVGAFVRWAVNRWPGCTIHCYEPFPGNYALLERTVATIGPEQSEIHVNQQAVYDKDSKIMLHLSGENCGGHSFFNAGDKETGAVEVEAIHAQKLPKADILKLDVEGAEIAILAALRDIGRLQEFKAIMLEYHTGMGGLAVKQLLTERGFVLTGEKVHNKERGELRFVAKEHIAAQKPEVTGGVLKKRPKVFIATPAHDHKFHSGFVYSLLKLGACGKFALTLNRVGGCGVARARNNMAAEFISKSSDEYYAAIDADIVFEPEHLERAIALDKPIVCVPYALKQDDLQWCCNTIDGEVPDPVTGFLKVATAGTGFMVIKREVFEHMIREFPELAYEDDLPEAKGSTRWDFFSMGVLKRRYLTEDWFFCVRARMLGYDIWLDAVNHVKHEGIIAYPIAKQRETMFEPKKKEGV